MRTEYIRNPKLLKLENYLEEESFNWREIQILFSKYYYYEELSEAETYVSAMIWKINDSHYKFRNFEPKWLAIGSHAPEFVIELFTMMGRKDAAELVDLYMNHENCGSTIGIFIVWLEKKDKNYKNYIRECLERLWENSYDDFKHMGSTPRMILNYIAAVEKIMN